MRTLEQRVKFDYGLTVGRHLVRFTLGDRERAALLVISPRGKVTYLAKPGPDNMYSSWRRMKGDVSDVEGFPIVWAARNNPELMARFEGAPVADIPLDEGARI